MGPPTSGSLVAARTRMFAARRVVAGEPERAAPSAVTVMLAGTREDLVWTVESTVQGYQD